MQQCSVLRWCSKNLFLKIFLASILLQYCLSNDIYDGDKSQDLMPLSRLDRARLLMALDDKNSVGGLMAYPRLGRRIWELTKTLIPYPRAGRLVVDPESLDYDVLLNVDYKFPELDESINDAVIRNQPVVQKRRNVKLIPRIGRKKRSVPKDENENTQLSEKAEEDIPKSDNGNALWDGVDDTDADYFFASDKKGMRSKSVFAPRIGKKRSDSLEEYLEGKRAAMFTPRIGRAALIPRIGRTDPRFRLKSRASFIPRIGRRAAFIPRVGRSENS